MGSNRNKRNNRTIRTKIRAHGLRRWLWALPVAVYLLIALTRVWEGDFNVDTGWYSAIALQAWRDACATGGGSLWTLMAVGGQGGGPYFNKPPLAFWIHGLVLWVLGPSVLAARLPAVAAGALCVALTGAIARRTLGMRAGVIAGLALATTIEFTRHTRAFSLDMWQAAFLLLMVWGVVASARAKGAGERRRWAGVAGVGLGLALMTKPLAGLLAAPILGVWWMIARGTGRANLWRGMSLLGAIALIGVAIAATWHMSMATMYGERFTGAYLGREIVERAAGRLGDANEAVGEPLYYLRVMATSAWPWIITAVLGIVMLTRRGCPVRARAGAWLAILWLAGWLVALSMFADKRPRYLLPAYPALAWVSALWLAGPVPAWAARGRRWLVRWIGPITLLGCVAVSLLPVRLSRPVPAQWPALIDLLKREDPANVWLGGFDGTRAARVYLSLGWWPRSGDEAGPGALILYHRRGVLRPGADETVVFQRDDVTMTRLDGPLWRPRSAGGRAEGP